MLARGVGLLVFIPVFSIFSAITTIELNEEEIAVIYSDLIGETSWYWLVSVHLFTLDMNIEFEPWAMLGFRSQV